MTLSFEDFLYNQGYEGVSTQNKKEPTKKSIYKVSQHILNEVLYIVGGKGAYDGRIGKVELGETQIKSILDGININKPNLLSQSIEQVSNNIIDGSDSLFTFLGELEEQGYYTKKYRNMVLEIINKEAI